MNTTAEMLFDLDESKSPRLKWMALTDTAAVHARGETEEDALISLAVKMGVPSWKEERV